MQSSLLPIARFATRFLGAFLLPLALAGAAAATPLDAETLARPGPYAVTTIDQTWTDAARQRALPVRLYVPAETAGNARAAIVFSHGLGGSRDGGAMWGRHWASHGFIAIHLQHPGSDDSLWKNRGATPLKEAMLAGFTPQAFRDRVADVQFAAAEIARRASAGDPIAVRIDQARLGMSGHSFGARTTQVIAGERLPIVADGLADPRFVAAIAFSPSANGPATGWTRRFSGIRIPFLSVTGTLDGDPFGGPMPAVQRTEAYRRMPGPNQYLLVLDGADHMVFNGGSYARNGSVPAPAVERNVRIATLAFWKAWLEDDAAAKAFLAGGAMRDALGAAGTFETKQAATSR